MSHLGTFILRFMSPSRFRVLIHLLPLGPFELDCSLFPLVNLTTSKVNYHLSVKTMSEHLRSSVFPPPLCYALCSVCGVFLFRKMVRLTPPSPLVFPESEIFPPKIVPINQRISPHSPLGLLVALVRSFFRVFLFSFRPGLQTDKRGSVCRTAYFLAALLMDVDFGVFRRDPPH